MMIDWFRPRILILVLWGSLLITVVASRWLYIVNDALNVGLVFYGSVIVPGLLLMMLLGGWSERHPVEFLAGGIALGLAVVLIVASIVVRFRLPVNSFWIFSFLFSGLLGLLNWQYSQPFKPSAASDTHGMSPFIELHSLNLILAFLLVLAVGVMVFLSVSAFGDFPTMRDFVMVDKKNYIPIVAMYAGDIENVGLSPIDRDLVSPSIQRLLWSGWLYLQAFWSETSHVSILPLVMRDLRASLIPVWAIINYALLYRLFKHHGLALFGLLGQAYFVNFMFASLFLYRLEEDKWMALYVMVPAALYILLWVLDTQTWRSYLCLLLVMLALGLLHPIGSPAMLLISTPFVIGEYIMQRFVERQKISIRPTAIILIILLSGLISPLFDRLYLTQQLDAPYTVVDSPYNPGFGYVEVAPIDPLMLLPVYTVVFMLLFVLRDRSSRFIALAIIVLWLMLYTTLGAYFGARLVTRAQLWRLRLVIPFGLAWVWWLGCSWKGVLHFVQDIKRQRYIMSGIASVFLVLMIGIAITHHRHNLIPWLVRYQNLESLAPETYDALMVFADVVDEEREVVIADPLYTLLMPTIFVKSQHVYYSFPEPNTPPDNFMQLYMSPTTEALNTIIETYNPHYIIVIEGSALDKFLSSNNTNCCQLLMTNAGHVLYVVNPD